MRFVGALWVLLFIRIKMLSIMALKYKLQIQRKMKVLRACFGKMYTFKVAQASQSS